MAQKKHSFALGCDYIEYTYSPEWNRSDVERFSGSDKSAFDDIALWLSYYKNNKYSLRFYVSRMYQGAKYLGPKGSLPDNFLSGRQASFYDLTAGYNVLHKKTPIKGLSAWGYAGFGISGPHGTALRFRNGVVHSYITEDSHSFDYKIYPTAQVLIKYNPIRYVFIGIGGTYHYLFWDFQPLSGNLSIGLQL